MSSSKVNDVISLLSLCEGTTESTRQAAQNISVLSEDLKKFTDRLAITKSELLAAGTDEEIDRVLDDSGLAVSYDQIRARLERFASGLSFLTNNLRTVSRHRVRYIL